jgi:hypothetical protein
MDYIRWGLVISGFFSNGVAERHIFQVSDPFSRLNSFLSSEIYFVNVIHNFQFPNINFVFFVPNNMDNTLCCGFGSESSIP